MKEIEVNTKMIAACGLYCGACKKYRMGKCQGCNTSDTDNPGLGRPLNEPTEKVALFEARLHILTLRPGHDTKKYQAKASVV